jgi:hypothetical protein
MAANLTATFSVTGSGKYSAAANASGRSDSLNIGQNGFDFSLPNLVYGTANTLDSSGRLSCNDWYLDSFSIAGTTTASIDVSGSGSYTNPFGTTLAFTSIRCIGVAIQSPDGALKVRVGPQNVANAAQLWFGGVGATAYEETCWGVLKLSPPAGWAITAGTGDLIVINNPGATAVTVAVFIAGVK